MAVPRHHAASQKGDQLPEVISFERAQQAFAGSYLAPLVAMVRAKHGEIRRQAIVALANLADDSMRPAVAALTDVKGRSLMVDLLRYTAPPLDLVQRREAIDGFTSLLRNPGTHPILLREKILADFLRLSRTCDPGSERMVSFSLATLCGNETIAAQLVTPEFIVEIIRLSSHDEYGDISVRRNAVHAVSALSFARESQVALKDAGALALAADLLQIRSDNDLRRQGATLAANLCLNERNKADVVESPLLGQLLASAESPQPGDDVDLALALGALASAPSLAAKVSNAQTSAALLALLRFGSRDGLIN